KELGIPTINVNMAAVPEEMDDGIYACLVKVCDDDNIYIGVMHYGDRPVFNDTRACEIHLLDSYLESLPKEITITVMQYLREVQNFKGPEELKNQIEQDIEACRMILSD
ncbi:hypothetical protein HN682_00290, partial [Candidatus Peregrinibacteria bacterium]|nr:hypothetical protein [Candidatus Peregrinibacteria bacterium]